MKKIKVGSNIKVRNASWSFDKGIFKKFDQHINKSIPLYKWSHDIGLDVSDFFLPNGNTFYDLGCSTGSFVKSLSIRHSNKNIKVFGIDEIQEMVNQSKKNNKQFKNVKILKGDITKIKFNEPNFISSFYTIQFIKPSKRQKLIDKIYKSLLWGGGFLIFEKVRAPDARFQDMITTIYNDFKLSNGFSADEIINKTKSLKGVMEPFSSKANMQMLKRAGFKDIICLFKFINFEGLLAIK